MESKYIIGESYSGNDEVRIQGKVGDLEKKLRLMMERHASLHDKKHSDATSLFGAAILSFTCRSVPRKEQAKNCMDAVLHVLSKTMTPIL